MREDRTPADATAPALSTAAVVRDACLRAALDAYDDAAMRGLCGEGALEVALDAIRRLDLAAVLRELPADE